MAEDVNAGISTILVFPRAVIDCGLADAVLASVGEKVHAEMCPPPAANDQRSLPDRLAEMARGLDWNPGYDRWRDLAQWPGLSGFRAVLRTWNEPMEDLVTRWPALLHEAGHDPQERPALIIGSDLDTAHTSRVEFEDALFVRDYWWWGTVDRIDTAVHLHRKSMTSDRLRLAAVEEIAAWDLGLAADLIHRWDGTRSKLPDVLRTVGLAPVELADDIGGAAGASEASRPPRAVRSRWDEGRVELWDAQLRGQMPMPGKAPSLEKLIWRAQSRIVMTHLDEQRTRLQGEFIRRASDEVLRGFHADRGDDAVWELGDMHHYVVSRQVQLPRPTQVYLAVARDVRNAIAHGRPAREGDIARLMAGLPTA